MKKYILLIISQLILGFVAPSHIFAQDSANKSEMNLHFVYIDHEVTTPVTELCSKLRTLQEDADEMNDALIIYLSDDIYSLFSFTNLKDIAGKGRDSEQAFVDIIAALQDANSHDVNAVIDVNNIIDLFDGYNFVNENGEILYNTVTFDFYVGARFWTLGNNEKVLARLYHVFSMDSLLKDKFTLNVLAPQSDHVIETNKSLFGDNNIDEINSKVRISEY